MSTDHKPEAASETRRIQERGGYVANVGGIHRVMGNLSVSRSLGDWYRRPYVIPHPGVSSRVLVGDEAFLLLATDGLWDVFDSHGACEFVAQTMHEISRGTALTARMQSTALRRLVAEARRRGSQDNITVLAAFF